MYFPKFWVKWCYSGQNVQGSTYNTLLLIGVHSRVAFLLYFPKLGETQAPSFLQLSTNRFFATNGEKNNLLNWRDGFFDFDPYTKIFPKFGKKSFNFQIWCQKLNFFLENKAIWWFETSWIVMTRSKIRNIAQFKKIKSWFSNFGFPNNVITVSACSKKFPNTGRNRKICPVNSLDYSFSYSWKKNRLWIASKTAALCDPSV